MSIENPSSILYNTEGNELAVSSSQALTTTQPGIVLAGSGSDGNVRFLQVADDGAMYVTGNLGLAISDVGQGAKGTADESWYMVITDGTSSAALGTSGSPFHVTGTVDIGNTVTIDPNGGSLTVDDGGSSITVDPSGGSFTVDDGGGSFTVDDGGSSLTVDGTVTSEVTGTVNLDRGNDNTDPLWVTGSTEVFGTVSVNEPVEITGSVAVNFNPNPTATVTQIPAAVVTTTLAAANASRRALTIFNDSTKILYIKLGSGATASDFSVRIVATGYYEIPGNYTGIVTGVWDNAGGSGNKVAHVTEITE